MAEKIEVAYKSLVTVPIPGSNTTMTIYHKYIVYTDSDGNEFIAHGGPDPDAWNPLTSDIHAFAGPAGSNENLYEGEWDDRLKDSRETIVEEEEDGAADGEDGLSVSDYWAEIVDAMKEISTDGHSYDLNQNSNSVVDTALNRAGLPLPQNDDYIDDFGNLHTTPGSDNVLPKDQDADDEKNKPDDLPFDDPFDDPPVSPLVLDMDGDGIELVALSDSKAMFDLDSDGFAQHTGWVASDDALLAIDRNDNGQIDDIDEVFGNGTVDGFSELAEMDSNEDGKIDASDERFGDLLLWRDKNGDGRSETDELQGLAEGGVKSIDLDATESETTLAGHSISHTSSFTRTDDTTDTIVDAWFENDRHISVYLPDDDFTLHEDVPALPLEAGFQDYIDTLLSHKNRNEGGPEELACVKME